LSTTLHRETRIGDQYEVLGFIGQGTYANVYRARDSEGRIYALKTIKLEAEDEGIPSTAIREISLLKELKHPNIVKLYNVVHSEKKLTLVFEYCDQDLKKALDDRGSGFDPITCRSYLFQLIRGIAYCHQHRVLHRDLKPQNLLINRDGVLKLADFGLARAFGIPVRSYTHEVVTLWYRAPDVLMGSRKYATSVDIWSIGCIMAEMITSHPLFPGQNDQDQLHKIFKGVGTPTVEDWPSVGELPEFKADFYQYPPQPWTQLVAGIDPIGMDLISKLLKQDPNQRISAKSALEHPYFKEILARLGGLGQSSSSASSSVTSLQAGQ